jgi:hypothetical protein
MRHFFGSIAFRLERLDGVSPHLGDVSLLLANSSELIRLQIIR